jgi:addiction module HigA family antidote
MSQMAVMRSKNEDFTYCQSQCKVQYSRLVYSLAGTLDSNGDLYPPNVDLKTDVFDMISLIVTNHHYRYNFDLELACKATLNVDKPAADWLVGPIACGRMAGVQGMTVASRGSGGAAGILPPPHPGELLGVWLSKDPRGHMSRITRETALTAREVSRIAECEAPVTQRVALELEKVLGPAAELWFRMQFIYDTVQATGREPEPAELPKLSRRASEPSLG